MNWLFDQVRKLEGKKRKPLTAMKDLDGKLLMKKADILHVWKTHFEKHLNTRFPRDEEALLQFQPVTQENPQIPPITEQEVKYAIKELSNRKSPGVDGITSELIKAGGFMMTKTLTVLFNKIIVPEATPNDWSKMIITPIHKKGDKTKSRKLPSNCTAVNPWKSIL